MILRRKYLGMVGIERVLGFVILFLTKAKKTLNTCSAMSAAALLLSCGTGLRAASKHSKVMVHQLSTMNFGKLEDIKSNAKFAEQLEDDCNTLMAEVTKKDKEFWKENQRSDYFLSANEALELGIIDKII